MALSPQQVSTQAYRALEPSLKSHEDRIDAMLVSAARDGKKAATYVAPNSALVREAIHQAYTSKGWKVELVLDQRDGDFFEFTSKS